MIGRCVCVTNQDYKYYGARGITVCQRWQESFTNFLADMGERPSQNYSLERRDNNGPYAPENCYWATKTQQARNTRTTVFVTHQGVTCSVPEWAEIIGIQASTLRNRLRKYGWSIERALTKTTKPGRNRKDHVFLTWNNETHCITEWGEILHIPAPALFARRKRGWPDDKILSTPLGKHWRHAATP
jgi:hypothetical protein